MRNVGYYSRLSLFLFCYVIYCADASLAFPVVSQRAGCILEPQLKAAEDFYVASTPQAMRAAVSEAKNACSNGSIHHELAANLAMLEANWDAYCHHIEKSLRDHSNDIASLHLEFLSNNSYHSWTMAERERNEVLLEDLMENHPSAEIRMKAGYLLTEALHLRGDKIGRERARLAMGVQIPLAVIGPWDNEQGKGFNLQYPPEFEVDLDAVYEGSFVEIGWRTNPPIALKGAELDLGELFSPNAWSISYALGAFRSLKAEAGEIRLISSVPFQVWFNGTLVFEEQKVEYDSFDQFILPVKVRVGVNRVLIKSAQNTGKWNLMVRLAYPDGRQIEGLTPVEFDSPIADGEKSEFITSEQMLRRRVRHLRGSSIRRAFHTLQWSRKIGLRHLSIKLADSFVENNPGSLIGRHILASELWNNAEPGRAADILSNLDKEAGLELPFLRLQYARFLRQKGLLEKARSALIEVRDRHPKVAEIWVRLAWLFREEKWLVDRCDALKEAQKLRSDWPIVRRELAKCLSELGFENKASSEYSSLLSDLPNDTVALSALLRFETSNEQLKKAESLAVALTQESPNKTGPWMKLAEIRRKREDRAGAEKALNKALEVNVDYAPAWRALGRIAYENGERQLAIDHWRMALAVNPEDEKLANRLAYLAPENEGPWMSDVPDEGAINLALASRDSFKNTRGANIINLLDHMVTTIKPDGSTVNFVTNVSYLMNESGRDALMRIPMSKTGKVRVLNAYVVGPDGTRTQASSLRNRTARFGKLKVGSAIVLQFRDDTKPVKYLSKYFAQSWRFNAPAQYTHHSEWIVWAAEGTTFNEFHQGDVQRTEQIQGKNVRLSFSVHDMPGVIAEPNMPTPYETLSIVHLSTVPDWDTFLAWEKALLHGAFRENAELEDLSRKLLSGLDSPLQKIERIQQYLMEEIRYQKDYENHIAGVKPHAASVVMQKGYGDCKDKAVMFITLARLAGVDVHFALLRTRNIGPLREHVPMQQFNHAIVYVPAQKGIEEGRFYDPTADALDIRTLRNDDPGTKALVLDMRTLKHQWIDIPYQSSEYNQSEISMDFQVKVDGSATGTLSLEAMGSQAVNIRRGARNKQFFGQAIQTIAGKFFPGSTVLTKTVVEVLALDKPARIEMTLNIPSYGKLEGEELRISALPVWSFDRSFWLAERQSSLILGIPYQTAWRVKINLPENVSVLRLPSSGTIKAGCFTLERQVTKDGNTVMVSQTFQTHCERIIVDDYAEHRDKATEMARFHKEEIVLKLDGNLKP